MIGNPMHFNSLITDPTAPSTPKAVQEVDAFLREGKSVCVFAKIAALKGEILYCLVPDMRRPRTAMQPALQSFLESRQKRYAEGDRTACIFVNERTPADDAEQRTQAFKLRVEAYSALVRLLAQREDEQAPKGQTLRAAVNKIIREQGEGVNGPRYGKQRTVVFSMGPRYRPQEHRRYAPHPLLAMTLRSDAMRMGKKFPGDRERTEFEAEGRSGSLERDFPFYDENLDMLMIDHPMLSL